MKNDDAIDPALPYLTAGMTGLDYGCGPTPTLSVMLRREGIRCEDYDPFFVGHPLQKTFDFVFSTEAFEHFFHPGREIRKIRALTPRQGIADHHDPAMEGSGAFFQMGTYGYCSRCEGPIGYQRLRAKPEALLPPLPDTGDRRDENDQPYRIRGKGLS